MWRKHSGSFLILAGYKTEGRTDLFNLIHFGLLQRADRTRTNIEFSGRETLVCINEYGTRSFQENNRLPPPLLTEHTLKHECIFFFFNEIPTTKRRLDEDISAKPSGYEFDNLLSGHNL